MGWPATREGREAKAMVEGLAEAERFGYLADMIVAMATLDFWSDGALAGEIGRQIGTESSHAPITAQFLRSVARKIDPRRKGAV